MSISYQYLSGFAAHRETEALTGALPVGQNSPQHPPFGLYAEQISGSAFTQPRHKNLRSWLYRIHPSVMHGHFEPYELGLLSPDKSTYPVPSPNQQRWDPLPYPEKSKNFVESLVTMVSNGSHLQQSGGAIHLYATNKSMNNEIFSNSDGELLIIPQFGDLHVGTEMGPLYITPGEIAVIPRGIKFFVALGDTSKARGYLLENFGAPLTLPDLGPIGANGLANPRDFLYPMASFQDQSGEFVLLVKYADKVWKTLTNHHPLDVVAWHGNYAPYKYDLHRFNTINSVSYDHPDPSIFTVLTSQTNSPGVANIDLVIFPERWIVAENTFRPPYFHRNIMSEFMGLIYGEYDAKHNGFIPGGSSLHNCMSAHGPDKITLETAIAKELQPERYSSTLAFMLESKFLWETTPFAQNTNLRQKNYLDCWNNIPKLFKNPTTTD